ncbi:ABC transporter permease [Staphylococcus sp. KG4-3]|nr:hypothetical protein [Staphylococcus xylosus]MBF0813523.1 ABC transporter permease [Staphylococcus saprophyticus]MDW8542154.1 ABC transporter permease [Staphylococcus sp. KG4-1]MRF36968.1 ABC transporter permease [Staphylococcus sp. KY49P]PTI04466.1 ABC transporter permease [Staphylococcus xylosus]TFV24190.1 ABC transporter permease [Staphylococcus saprophyticus]
MLYSFLKYEHLKFLTSYQFIAPVFTYLLWVIGIYIYRDMPVLSSYGSTAIGLFIVMTWMTIINFGRDTLNERHIFYMQLKSKTTYLLIKILYLYLFSTLLIIFSLIYPLLLSVFDKPVSFNFVLIGIVTHLLLSMFGIVLGAFITNTKIATKSYRWLLTIFIMLIIFTKEVLITTVPFTKWILWLLPPISNLLNQLNSDNLSLLNNNFLLLCLFAVIYILIALKLLIVLFKKTE